MRLKITTTHLLVLGLAMFALISAACGTPAPSDGPRVTPSPIPTSEAWTEPASAITLENVTNLRELGLLYPPEPPSTAYAYAIAPDQTALAVLNRDWLIAWDLVSGEQLYHVPHRSAVQLYYSPDKDEIFTISADGRIEVFNAETGFTKYTLTGHQQYAGYSAYLPDDGLLVVTGTDGTYKVWDVVERTSLVTHATGLDQPISSLAAAHDGKRLAIADANGTVQIWDWKARQRLIEIETLDAVSGMLFSPDDRFLVTSSPQATAVWHVNDGQRVHVLNTGGYGDVFRFVSNTNYLMTNSGTPEVLIWDIEIGEVLGVMNRVGRDRVTVATSPDGKLAYLAELGAGATLWSLENLADGAVGRSTQQVDATTLFNVAWTKDSFLALFFDTSGLVRVWGIGG